MANQEPSASKGQELPRSLQAPAERIERPAPPAESHYVVKFHDKKDQNDTDKVILSVNGEPLQITRQVEVTIPERYKVCADNAYYNVYRQLPGETRKVVGRVKDYPYDIISDQGRSEDFKRMWREGTQALNREIQSGVPQS